MTIALYSIAKPGDPDYEKLVVWGTLGPKPEALRWRYEREYETLDQIPPDLPILIEITYPWVDHEDHKQYNLGLLYFDSQIHRLNLREAVLNQSTCTWMRGGTELPSRFILINSNTLNDFCGSPHYYKFSSHNPLFYYNDVKGLEKEHLRLIV